MNLKVCEGCLSVNRILKTVNERERKLFYNFIYTNYSKNHLELCWECRALLKKFLRFKLQVRQARDVLDCFVVHHTILNSLSSLRTTQCKFEVISSVECSQETTSLPSVKIEVDEDVQDFTAEKLFDDDGVDKEALVNAIGAEMDTIENELIDDESYINGATSAVSETDTTFEQNQHTTECQNVVVCSVLCKERVDPSLISVKIEDDKDVFEDFSPGNTFNDDDMGLMINVSHSLNTEIDLKIDIIENETIENENNTEDLFDCSDDELHMIKEKKRTSKIKRRMSLNGIEHVPKLSKPQNGYQENSTGSDSTSSGNEHTPMRRIIEDINVPSTKHGDFSTPKTFDNTSNDIQKLHIPSATTELEDPAVKRRKTINNLIRHLFLKHADEEDLKNCYHLSKKSEEQIKTIASFPKRDDFPDKRRLPGDIHPCASETLWRKIFPIFKNDAIVRCIKYDEIIIKFGNKLCEQYTLTHQHEHIRAQLRLLGRLKNEMMILDETIFELMSVFDPKQFDNLIKSIKIIASWNEQIMWYDLPSVAQNLTTLIKKCAKKLRVECIKSEDNNRKSLVENFLLLWEEKMPTIINKKALENQVAQKQRKKAILPARSDITLLYNYLQEQCFICLEILTDEFQNNAWVLLIQSTLILVQVLNGRRAGEIERLTLIDYENKTSLNENVVPGIYNKLSDNAREYAAQYKRLTIRGERGRIVPVLLSPIAVICIDLIIKYRKEAKIASSNEYIFSKPNGSKLSKPYFRARPLMRRFANDCYVLIPSALRGTTLRKLIAPYIGMLNIKESHVDRLAYIMGNNKDILKNIYRMPVPVAEMADVSGLLRSAIGDDDEEGNEASDEENSDSSDEDVNDGNDDPELDTHENTNKRKSSHTLISENGETY